MGDFWNTLNDILGRLGDDEEDDAWLQRTTPVDPSAFERDPYLELPQPAFGPPGDYTLFANADASPSSGQSDRASQVGADSADSPETVTVTARRGPPFTQGDRDLLGRMIFTEGAQNWQTPGLFEAIGSSAVNRLGDRYYRGNQSLQGALTAKGQFQGVNDTTPGSLWLQSADPSSLTGANAKAYARAQQVADGLLSGQIPDNTGGATSFYSSHDGMPVGQFRDAMSEQIGKGGQLVPPQFERSRMDIGPFTFLRRTR